MASVLNFRALDSLAAETGLDLASKVFHRINRIIPVEQKVLTVPPKCLVRDAIALLRKNHYSQVPVVDGGEVLGVFSYRSFALEAANTTLKEWNDQKCSPGDLQVDDFLEPFQFVSVTDEIRRVFDAMDHDNGVLIGSAKRLIGILTPMDFLRYLYDVASPFVLVSEIELALRALIGLAMTPAEIAAAAKRALSSKYGDESKVPTALQNMTFDNYQVLIAHGETWKDIEWVFGGTRNRTSAKLKQISALRNDVFHFRREITIDEHQALGGHRDWLLSKVKQAEVTGRPGQKS